MGIRPATAGFAALVALAAAARAETGVTNIINGVSTNAGGPFFVGSNGSYNALVITNAGKLTNTFGYIGFTAAASNNAALITGAGLLRRQRR